MLPWNRSVLSRNIDYRNCRNEAEHCALVLGVAFVHLSKFRLIVAFYVGWCLIKKYGSGKWLGLECEASSL